MWHYQNEEGSLLWCHKWTVLCTSDWLFKVIYTWLPVKIWWTGGNNKWGNFMWDAAIHRYQKCKQQLPVWQTTCNHGLGRSERASKRADTSRACLLITQGHGGFVGRQLSMVIIHSSISCETLDRNSQYYTGPISFMGQQDVKCVWGFFFFFLYCFFFWYLLCYFLHFIHVGSHGAFTSHVSQTVPRIPGNTYGIIRLYYLVGYV